MTTVRPVRHADRLTPEESAAVLAVAEAAAAADGVFALAEDTVLAVRHAPASASASGADAGPDTAGTGADGDAAGVGAARVHLLSFADDGLAGYAYLDRSDPGAPSGELVVHPRHRREGYGTALLAAVASAVPGATLSVWAHGDGAAARTFAEGAGFARARVLWQMRRPLTEPLPDVPLPAGVTVRHFRPGFDDAGWLRLNARAFADHPEQGRWTETDLRLRMAEPWFDPEGFLLAVDVADTLLGFHWTKVHPARGDVPRMGEIYVLGVDPGGHRRGLGAALSLAGLQHLAQRGVRDALLYVDESNSAAVALYQRLGFTVFAADVSYQKRVPLAGS
ncbi:mycothiol synthase [Krasilnikovia cinnamomea]|uniref:Mycothiol acetyltransferase n=1 Tax=Krasilnikovia cinnamomea TaxID=349313 RepID=A0A4Q7ZI37_9ACTN|nr:mycothiol synthase [Krasilnikovia cinnamomea]RZU50512.1 mycothiol synthase [Krasilnikovia cinnamomea]